MAYLTNLSPDSNTRTLQLLEAVARELGLLPPLPVAQGPTVPTVTTSIGTDARDYSTITAWEADLDNVGVYASGDDAVGECYDDSEFDESVTFDGGGTVGLSSVTLTAAEGERHDGTAGTGVRNIGSSARSLVFGGIGYTFDGIELANTDCGFSHSSTRSGLHRIIIHDRVVSVGNAIFCQNAGTGITVLNSIGYDLNANSSIGRSAVQLDTLTTDAVVVANFTLHNCQNNGSGGMTGLTLADEVNKTCRNTLVTGSETSDFSLGGTVTQDHNASSDATASGTGSLTNIVTADQYVSTVGGSEDLHLKSGSDCIGAGADLGTTPSGVQFDIDGYDRDANGVTWDIGADQFVGSPGASLLLTRTLMGVGV